MRRTLTVLVASAALLVPATAASAAPAGGFSNASCNSGQQRGPEGSTYNLKGNTAVASAYEGCGPVTDAPEKGNPDAPKVIELG